MGKFVLYPNTAITDQNAYFLRNIKRPLTMSLVNVSFKLGSLNMAYMLIFLLQKCE